MWTRLSTTLSTMGRRFPVGRGPDEEMIASSGVTFHLWRLYQHFWLVSLCFPLVALVREPHSWQRLVPGVLTLLLFAISYTWMMWPHPVNREPPSRLPFLFLVLLFLLITVWSLVDGPAWLWLFIGVSALAGVLLPMRRAFAAIVLCTLLPIFITIGTGEGLERIDWWWLIALILLIRGLGLDMIGVARLSSALRELYTTRQALARLKVEEERLRLARDLHDLLGQTLSMITLKSELARHLITEDAERCAQELAEIEQVARKSLREVRQTVAGYRQPHLISELDAARQLLGAAGIDAQIETMKEALPPALDAVLAWTVREGVTNIIRHSRARHCHIRFVQKQEWVGVEVVNDGERRGSIEHTDGSGLGLTGLRERVSALEGYMDVEPCTISGQARFRLCVEVPLGRRVQKQEEGR